jgi:hypothetical protein
MRFCCASGFEGLRPACRRSGLIAIQDAVTSKMQAAMAVLQDGFQDRIPQRGYFQFFFRLPFALSRRYM